MFTSRVDSVPDGGVRSENLLFPIRFVWRYGGRNIFLTGTFTRWSEHIRMSPVEGCPSVFQAICSVTPGLHQYKFYVDGEWRHDERQPFVSGDYGIVNTLQVSEPDSDPLLVGQGSSLPRENMDVDNDTLQYSGTVSINTLQEVGLRITGAGIEASRNHVSIFLSTHTAYDLLPQSGKVVALDVNLPVKQAFHILYEQGIPVAPLWDSYNGGFVGMLSAMDFILILREIGNHGSNLTEEELETHTISAWKGGKQQLNRLAAKHGKLLKRPLIHASPYDSLKDVALKILQNEVATVPIIHSSVEDGSLPQLLHLASLSGILKCICRQFRHSSSSLPILQQPICMLPLGTWVPKTGQPDVHHLAMLKPNASLNAALSLFVQARVSSIPIIDDNGSLLDIYSRSDITALAKDRAYAQIRLDEISIHQALQFGQDASFPFSVFNGQRCQMCLRSDSLIKVMERLSDPGVRRLIIVEAGSKRVEGIISLTDVFKLLIG